MQDLSHLADGALSMGASMHGGNTVSPVPAFGSKGSESEGSADIPVHSTPEMDLGPKDDRHLDTKKDDAGARPASPYSWKKVN